MSHANPEIPLVVRAFQNSSNMVLLRAPSSVEDRQAAFQSGARRGSAGQLESQDQRDFALINESCAITHSGLMTSGLDPRIMPSCW